MPWISQRHASDVEHEARQHHRGQEGDDQRDLAGDELVLGDRGDQKSDTERHQQIEHRYDDQYPQGPAQRHAKQHLTADDRECQPQHAEDEIGYDLAEQDFAGPGRGDEQRLERATFPFARHDQRRQQRADQRHDENDQPRHQKIGAVIGLVEPEPRLQIDRCAGNSGPFPAQPRAPATSRPRLAHSRARCGLCWHRCH